MFPFGSRDHHRSPVVRNEYRSRAPLQPTSDPLPRVHRDTLFVSSESRESAGKNSEWVVSYDACSKESEISRKETMAPVDQKLEMLDFDLTAVSGDMFALARVLISYLLLAPVSDDAQKFGRRCVRMKGTLADARSLLSAFHGILIASTVVKLRCVIVKRSSDSSDVLLIAHVVSPTVKPSDIVVVSQGFLADLTILAGELIRITLSDPRKTANLSLLSDSHIMSLLKIVSVITYESLRDSGVTSAPILGIELEPGGGENVSVLISSLDSNNASSDSKDALLEIVQTPSTSDTAAFLTRLLEAAGSIIRIDLSNSADPMTVANAVIRLFMAGYCLVDLVPEPNQPFLHSSIAELILVTAKFFALTVEVVGAVSMRLERQTSTTDPNAAGLSATPTLDKREFSVNDSTLAIVHAVLGLVVGTRSRSDSVDSSTSGALDEGSALQPKLVEVWIPRSVVVLAELLSALSRIGTVRIRFIPPTSSDPTTLVRLSIISKELTGDIPTVLAAYSPQDVSPSNNKPVDVVVRYGSDDEVALYQAKLDGLTGMGGRLSVLLVGPRNIGLGVRMLATHTGESGVGNFEFVSERAVRDPQGSSLKCAVRLFIRRVVQLSPPPPGLPLPAHIPATTPPLASLLGASRVVRVSETDSRIIVANKLFAFLNEAPNSNPYVLIEAQGDHCVFIAAMSVVVANGWSRAIQQRVETKVVLAGAAADEGEKKGEDEIVVYYITRLIVNT